MAEPTVDQQPTLVRATVHLAGRVKAGDVFYADGSARYVIDCIEAGYLVPVTDPTTSTGA